MFTQMLCFAGAWFVIVFGFLWLHGLYVDSQRDEKMARQAARDAEFREIYARNEDKK